MLAFTAVAMAYLAEHPEVAEKLPSPAAGGGGLSSPADDWNDLQHRIAVDQATQRAISDQCHPPVGCVPF